MVMLLIIELKTQRLKTSVHQILSPLSALFGLFERVTRNFSFFFNASFIIDDLRIPKDIFYFCVNRISVYVGC